MREFAVGGMSASGESIARQVGISQPYLFRLYAGKKALFLAAIDRCFATIEQAFRQATTDLTGDACIDAMGDAYAVLLADDPVWLQMQMQAYSASTVDTEVRDATIRNYNHLWDTVVAITGMDDEQTRSFFAAGMLMNVSAALNLQPGGVEPLAARLARP